MVSPQLIDLAEAKDTLIGDGGPGCVRKWVAKRET